MGTEKRERQKANRALKQQQVQQAQSRRVLMRKVAIGVAGLVAVILFVWIASNVVGGDSPSTPEVDPGTPITTSDATIPNVTIPDATIPDVTVPTTGG